MKKVSKQYSSIDSCKRHLKLLRGRDIKYTQESIKQIGERCYEVSYKVIVKK